MAASPIEMAPIRLEETPDVVLSQGVEEDEGETKGIGKVASRSESSTTARRVKR